jgi:hypothetical protein
MMLRKWRVAATMDQDGKPCDDRLAGTPALRRYRESLVRVDELLRMERERARCEAPPHLGPRIMQAIRESQRVASLSTTRRGTARRVLPLAFAAAIACAGAVGLYVSSQGPGDLGRESGTVDLAVESASDRNETPHRADVALVAFPAQPVGRLMLERVGSPLMNEAELLRRDTQYAAELVIGSLPFASR